MTWPRQRTAVPTGTCRLLGACVQPFHDPIRGYGVRVLLRWYRIELFRSSILYRQRLYADAETLTLRVRVGGQMSASVAPCCLGQNWPRACSGGGTIAVSGQHSAGPQPGEESWPVTVWIMDGCDVMGRSEPSNRCRPRTAVKAVAMHLTTPRDSRVSTT